MGYEHKSHKLPSGFVDLAENLESNLPATPKKSKSGKIPKVYYPELHFTGKHAKHLSKLGKHGTAVIHFKKVSESKNEHTGADGKPHTSHSVGIQIHGIKPHDVEGAEHESEHDSEHKPDSSEVAIEKGLEAAESETNDKE
jgi:hypothetical protein